MKQWAKYLTMVVFAAGLMLTGAADLSGQVRKKPVIRKKTTVVKRPVTTARLYTIPAGKRIRVRMADTISSKTAKVGDRFTAVVREPVYASTGAIVIPEGSEVIGRVDAVVPARKGGKPGTLDLSFTQIVLPNGSRRAINGSLTELVSDDAKSDSEGTASGDRMKHRKVVFIGGGGAGGAILGAAVGGGKGALIGGLLGAGGGFLGEKLTKGEEAQVRSGTEFGVYLNRPISLPRFAETDTRQ